MISGMKTVIHPVKDLGAARRLHGALLGVAPVMDEPHYVGFRDTRLMSASVRRRPR
jgi:hypothetical protein